MPRLRLVAGRPRAVLLWIADHEAIAPCVAAATPRPPRRPSPSRAGARNGPAGRRTVTHRRTRTEPPGWRMSVPGPHSPVGGGHPEPAPACSASMAIAARSSRTSARSLPVPSTPAPPIGTRSDGAYASGSRYSGSRSVRAQSAGPACGVIRSPIRQSPKDRERGGRGCGAERPDASDHATDQQCSKHGSPQDQPPTHAAARSAESAAPAAAG